MKDIPPVVVVDEEEADGKGLSAIGRVRSGKCFLRKRCEEPPLQRREEIQSQLHSVRISDIQPPGSHCGMSRRKVARIFRRINAIRPSSLHYAVVWNITHRKNLASRIF